MAFCAAFYSSALQHVMQEEEMFLILNKEQVIDNLISFFLCFQMQTQLR